MGGISAFELGFGDKWNVEMEQSVAESPTHTICDCHHIAICTLADAVVALIAMCTFPYHHSCLGIISVLHSFISGS